MCCVFAAATVWSQRDHKRVDERNQKTLLGGQNPTNPETSNIPFGKGGYHWDVWRSSFPGMTRWSRTSSGAVWFLSQRRRWRGGGGGGNVSHSEVRIIRTVGRVLLKYQMMQRAGKAASTRLNRKKKKIEHHISWREYTQHSPVPDEWCCNNEQSQPRAAAWSPLISGQLPDELPMAPKVRRWRDKAGPRSLSWRRWWPPIPAGPTPVPWCLRGCVRHRRHRRRRRWH